MMKAIRPFRNGEKIVCLGDSITHDGYWLYYLSEYVWSRTGCQVEFINAGVSGGNSGGGLIRIGYDVIDRRPNRVIVNFGMNDVMRALYNTKTPSSELADERAEALERFRERMTEIVQRLLENGIDVILMTTLPFDQYDLENSYAQDLICCNSEGLARLNKIVRGLSEKFDVSFIDVFTPMTEFYSQYPKMRFTLDRVHPERFGYLLATAWIVESIYGKQQNSLSVSPTATQTDHVSIDALEFTSSGCQFIWKPHHIPFHRDAAYQRAASVWDIDLLLNMEIWHIGGLPDARYKVEIGGMDCGCFSALELQQGINAMQLHTPLTSVAVNAAALIKRFNDLDLSLRRLAQCELIIHEEHGNPESEAETKRILDAYLKAVANSPYAEYYIDVIREYWTLRSDKARFAKSRSQVLQSLCNAVRPLACTVKISKTN